MATPSRVRSAGRDEPAPPVAEHDSLDIRTMHRLTRPADGGAALVRWLRRRTGCWVGLLDGSGSVLLGDRAGPGPGDRSLVADAITTMLRRGLRTCSVDDGRARRAVLMAVDVPERAPGLVLAFVGARPVPSALAADAATLVATCWWAEQTRRVRLRVDAAERRCREAVLRLLMAQDVPTASQVAATLHSPLPEPMRVHVIECRPGDRPKVLRRVTELAGEGPYIVPCPVYSRHVVAIAPAYPGGSTPDARPFEVTVAAELTGCVVGTGDTVALDEAPIGYQQAFHALAVARGREERRARFDADLDLPSVIGPAGLTWANTVLAPLVIHVPARASDPDAQVLAGTARSWLTYGNGATRHLKIHRNTLSGRLRRIEELLGLDLDRSDQQAVLDLALRIRATPRPQGPAQVPAGEVDLDRLLRLPAVRQWAHAALRPLRTTEHADALEQTLRAWLDDFRVSTTATALGISIGGVRKRITKLEQLFQRSLLHPPSARHELWMAVRAADLDAGDVAMTGGSDT